MLNLADLTADDVRAVLDGDDEELKRQLAMLVEHPFYTFQPRPDDPQDHEEQSSFVEQNYHFDPTIGSKGQFVYRDGITFKICLGGTGSGKTHGAAYKTAQHVLTVPPPREHCPFWVIGSTFDQVCPVCWKEKLVDLIPASEIHSISWYSKVRQWPKAVLLRHPVQRDKVGWILDFKSYEQGITAAKGFSIGGYWFNEEVPYDLVSEVQGRCREYDSPGWADFTPIECKDAAWPDTYELVQSGSGMAPKGWQFYHLNTKRNHYLADGWFANYIASVPEDLRELRTIGKFTTLQGAVFKEFRKSIHVIDPTDEATRERYNLASRAPHIPRDWRKIRGIDFGFNDPFACLWCARDHDDRYFVYDEHFESGRLIDYHAAQINKREWDNQPWYGPTYSDHDPQIRAELSKHKISTVLASKAGSSIEMGIELLRSLMIQKGDGKPQLLIFNHCSNLLREIAGYKYPPGTDRRAAGNIPMDVNNHCLVAGTLIDTDRGLVPIENVTTRDAVITRTGWRRVLFSGPTRFEATTTVTLDDGRTIEGTGDHPVWVVDRGWVCLSDLTRYSMLLSITDWSKSCDAIACQPPSESSLMVCHTDDIQNPTSGNCESITLHNAADACIKLSGSIITGLSLPAAIFTTGTKIRSTTILETLNARMESPTLPSTRPSFGHNGTLAPHVAPVRVVAVSHGSEPKQTYDLTVEHDPEFFANGVLVHNSLDALRYAIFSDKQGRRKLDMSGKKVHPNARRFNLLARR